MHMLSILDTLSMCITFTRLINQKNSWNTFIVMFSEVFSTYI